MSALRYGISLRAFNSTSNSWVIELNTRRETLYLQATMYYFVYHIKTVALYWQEESTFLMNDHKRINNPQIKIGQYVSAKAKDEKKLWIIITKTTMGVIFNLQNLTLSLPIEKNLSGERPKSAYSKSSICRFSFSAAINATTKATK